MLKINLSLILGLILYTATGQEILSLQPDPINGKDAKVFSLSPTENFGNDNDFIAATWTFSGEEGKLRSMVDFDLSAIPAGATIIEAKLSLFYNFVSPSAGHGGNNSSFLRRILESWNENTVTWNTQPAATSINQVLLPESNSEDQDYEHIVVTELVKDMIANPASSFGFMFLGQAETPLKSMKFFSSDATQATQRPKLEITYILDPVECITIQPGSEGKDAKVFSLTPSSNFGNDKDLIAAAWTFGGQDGVLRSFIEFDLSSIPVNMEVVSAYLSLYYNDETPTAGHEGSNSSILQRILEPWEETTINWNNQPASTNLHQVQLTESSSETEDYTNINVTELVKDMLDNPAASYGFSLKQEVEEIFRSMKFSSSDINNPDKLPKLEVCLTEIVSNHEFNKIDAKIIPNPFINSIQIDGLEGINKVIITDLNGKIVFNKIFSSITNLLISELNTLPSGIYFIKASGPNGIYYDKIIKANS